MPVDSCGYTVKGLNSSTWDDFATLVERHNGVWGGCWCMEFHPEGAQRGPQRREQKEERVRSGNAHASLVYDGPRCVGWCQFGPPFELPRIKHRREYEAKLLDLPDWRITCFFVDSNYRKSGVSEKALQGALDEIAKLGGGIVESYPEDTTGHPVSSSFLYNSNLSIFLKNGFEKVEKLGKNHWIVRKKI
jgi:GNAT superfamily N-acetyltransferase